MTSLAAVLTQHGTAATLAGSAVQVHLQDLDLRRQRGWGAAVHEVRRARATVAASVTVPAIGAALVVAAGPHAGAWTVVSIVSRDPVATVLEVQLGQAVAVSARQTGVTA